MLRKPVFKRLEQSAKKVVGRAGAQAALASEELTHKVRAEERAAWDLNITGVPAMVVENKFMIPGAQPPEAYADALRRVAEKTAA